MEFGDHLLGMRLVIVDDEPLNLRLLHRLLGSAGFTDIETTTSPVQALASCANRAPDLLLLDLHMPQMDGYGVMETLGPRIGTGDGLPVLVLTGDHTVLARRRALDAGARDFVSKPFDPDEVLLRVRNLLEIRHCQQELARQNERLEAAVRARTSDLEASRVEVLDRLALAGEYHDHDTNRHARRIGRTSATIASRLGFRAERLWLLEQAAALHDIGKIAVPDTILRKPGRLTPGEQTIMQRHTTVGARMLAGSRSPVLQLAERIALTHHERWDGTGYPQHLVGDEIPLEGRVVAVADVFDALTHIRPYKRAWGAAEAAAAIRAGSGTQFDPDVVAAFDASEPAALHDRLDAELDGLAVRPLDQPASHSNV